MSVLGQAQEFANRLEHTLRGTLPGSPNIRAQLFETTGRVRISAVDDQGSVKPARLPLYVDQVPLAYWTFYMFTDASYEGFLRVDEMRIALFSQFEDSPIVRLEYEGKTTGPPVSHWQFHGERGALSFLLARAYRSGKKGSAPMSLSSLHFPTGGRRFRPGVEDFIQFLIQDCGVDQLNGWKRALEDGREIARRFQVRTIARDYPAEVAQVLRDRGWSLTPPDNFDEWESREALREY